MVVFYLQIFTTCRRCKPCFIMYMSHYQEACYISRQQILNVSENVTLLAPVSMLKLRYGSSLVVPLMSHCYLQPDAPVMVSFYSESCCFWSDALCCMLHDRIKFMNCVTWNVAMLCSSPSASVVCGI
jgi:hypothetical protein